MSNIVITLNNKTKTNLNDVLKGWFKFNEWSAYKNDATEFENTLDKFGQFDIYTNFKEFLKYNPIYLENDETGQIIDIKQALSNEENFNEFMQQQFNQSSWHEMTYENIDKPFLFGQINDSTEPTEHFISLEEIRNENDLIVFINEVLNDLGEVTHSTGRKNKYEVVSIDYEMLVGKF